MYTNSLLPQPSVFAKRLQYAGLFFGTVGFFLPLFFSPENLSLPGQLALGIFILAGVYWITEPVPIYATSMIVIFLQVILLSDCSPVYTLPKVSTFALRAREASHLPGEPLVFSVPQAAISVDNKIFVAADGNKFTPVAIERFGLEPQQSIVPSTHPLLAVRAAGESVLLAEGVQIAADASHWKLHYTADKYSAFYATLASPIIILFLGGFSLAAAAVKYGLDKNLTRILLKPFGTRPSYVCLGLMCITAFLSAFMSNTATTAMMMTVILPIAAQLDTNDPFRRAITLSIPFAANIGGIATPIGTPPNAIALSALAKQGIHITFTTWMMIAVPLAIIMLFLLWRLMLWFFPPATQEFHLSMSGKFSTAPKAIASYVVFGLTVVLWVTEALHGLSSTVVAFLPLAALPALQVLDKHDIRGLSWEVLWLVAGGISLGISTTNTGLMDWLVGLVNWKSLNGVILLLVLTLFAYGLGNLISNTVAAAILIPIAVGLQQSGGASIHLVSALLLIALTVSFSMTLAISTPPNAIAMSTGFINTKDMAIVGLCVGLVGILGILCCATLFWPHFTG